MVVRDECVLHGLHLVHVLACLAGVVLHVRGVARRLGELGAEVQRQCGREGSEAKDNSPDVVYGGR